MNIYRQSELDYALENRDITNYQNLIRKVHEKRFTIKDVGLNYRWITHWQEKDLLFGEYEEGKWRKFDLIEFIWLKMIILMRKFNISLDRIREIKTNLNQDAPVPQILENEEIIDTLIQFASEENRDAVKKILKDKEFIDSIQFETINLFETLIMQIITFQSSFSILICGDEIVPFNHSLLEDPEFKSKYNDLFKKSFISISISEILRDYMIGAGNIKEKNRLAILTEAEEKVLTVLREQDLKSVIVRYGEDKNIDLIEIIRSEKIDKRARLIDFLMTNGYQDITIKTQNGEIVYCENKRKIMIQNKK
jgi:DNA-binding transcriptional MerR regulator